jgi:3D-(3,5/4)-trihydroxycyclohexane-1,2-dione acylhydrolase (decyclizing)
MKGILYIYLNQRLIGILNDFMTEKDVMVMLREGQPGDLQTTFRPLKPKQYHVEYAYSCVWV